MKATPAAPAKRSEATITTAGALSAASILVGVGGGYLAERRAFAAAFAVASLLALLALVTLGLKSFVEWRQAQVQNYD